MRSSARSVPTILSIFLIVLLPACARVDLQSHTLLILSASDSSLYASLPDGSERVKLMSHVQSFGFLAESGEIEATGRSARSDVAQDGVATYRFPVRDGNAYYRVDAATLEKAAAPAAHEQTTPGYVYRLVLDTLQIDLPNGTRMQIADVRAYGHAGVTR